MSDRQGMSRRAVLRGLGTAMALPALEAMHPWFRRAAQAAERGAATPLNRMVFIFAPNGKVMEDWTPKDEGAEYTLSPLLEPLAGLREDFCVLSGLGHANGMALGDGPGDHARASASYLTAAHPFKTGGKNIRLGISVDQVAATQVGGATRLASLELGCDKPRNSGDCDSGYSCIYSHNVSWRTEYMPMPKEVDPRLAFDRLFAGNTEGLSAAAMQRSRYRQSVLDLVREDAARIRSRVGATDKRKIDEYFASVRDIERRIERLVYVRDEDAEQPLPSTPRPVGVPREYQEHVRIMYDLLALALQTDVSRISTFMVGHAGSNRSYKFLDVPDGHHGLSHHGGDKDKIAAIRKINHFHVGELARFLEKLRSMPEGDSTVLDHAMIVYGSGLGDGNRHDHLDLPVLLAGRGSGTIAPGRHLRYPARTPMANLFVSLLDRMGTRVDNFGDSTGRLQNLKG